MLVVNGTDRSLVVVLNTRYRQPSRYSFPNLRCIILLLIIVTSTDKSEYNYLNTQEVINTRKVVFQQVMGPARFHCVTDSFVSWCF